MDAVILLGILLFAAIGGCIAFFLVSPPQSKQTGTLVPFSVLPVPDSSASTSAFLALFASQVAWMDSSILQSVVLMYPDDDAETAAMCEEIARQYDFFTCMSMQETKQLMEQRMLLAQSDEKNSESSCNLSGNAV